MDLLEHEWSIIREGLAQIPPDGLLRLLVHIEAGKPLLLNGRVMHPSGEYG